MIPVEPVNSVLAVGTIGGQLLLVALVYSFFFRKSGASILAFFGKNAVLFSFFLALGATVGTLFYSEIVGYAPCALCWYQRIFLWPQVIILGIALWRKDRNVSDYSIALSILGGIVALYHHLLQTGITSLEPCAAEGTISCAQVFVLKFGYITMPMMALTAFLLIIAWMSAKKLYDLISPPFR